MTEVAAPAAPTTPAPERRRTGRGVVRRVVREVGLGMITLGVVLLLFVAYQLWGTALTEEHDQHILARSFAATVAHNEAAAATAHRHRSRKVTAEVPADVAPSTPTGMAVAHLVIPAIGVDKFVVQGTGESQLMQGPGHYVDTPMPGESGHVGIAGHRTTYGAPFYELGNLHRGDLVELTTTTGRTFDYKVTAKEVVSPNDVAVLDPTRDAQLTLTTCNPPYSATNRLVVVAGLVGTPVPTPRVVPEGGPTRSRASSGSTARPVASGAIGNNLGQGNGAAWPPAIAYGAGFLALWILTRLALARTRRWRRLGALVVGLGLCALPLWLCFENVVRLLPQNI